MDSHQWLTTPLLPSFSASSRQVTIVHYDGRERPTIYGVQVGWVAGKELAARCSIQLLQRGLPLAAPLLQAACCSQPWPAQLFSPKTQLLKVARPGQPGALNPPTASGT